ncbi:MAG: hypothetical protein C4297_11425 [Gemmataceae bacterium]
MHLPRSILTLTASVIVLGCLASPGLLALAPAKQPVCATTSLDVALGHNRRGQFAAELARRRYGGRTHPWSRYATWGRQLLVRGQVENPPEGPAPSQLVSQVYRCVHCHNLAREDKELTRQDPVAREQVLRAANYPDPARRDGHTLSLTPGTTLWGAVNRESFYNGFYARYHVLRLADGRPMNPRSLEDAIQICCQYCSVGRFPEPWELDSILAALWEFELKLSDLDWPSRVLDSVLDDLNSGDARRIANARQQIRQNYLTAAGADLLPLPVRTEGATDIYEDGARVTGNARAGQWLYQSACAGCHGTEVHPMSGRQLLITDKRFHEYVLRGTHGDDIYMPFFPAQRLSRQQVADIRAYLKTLR